MHTNFERAFTDGLVLEGNGETLTLRVETRAPFPVTRELLLSDPGFDDVQLRATLEPGEYEAQASIAQAGGNEIVAALRVVRRGATVVKWEDLGTLSCDAGWLAMSAREGATPEQEGLWSFANDVVASQAGFGDGGYGVFVGRDERGRAVACVIDYFVLVGPRMASLVLPVRGRVTHESGVVVDVGGDVFVRVDASRRVSDEVTDFKLRAYDAGGNELFVGYSAQGNVYEFDRPDGVVARMELSFQAGVVAL